MSKILTKREIIIANVNEKHFIPTNTTDVLNYMKDRFSSIEEIDYYCTTSSAGDWEGVIIQKLGKNKKVAILFSIESRMWLDGFVLHTGNQAYPFPNHYTLDEIDIYAYLEDLGLLDECCMF